MIDKPLAEIVAEDLQRLHTNGVPESRSLEYKQALPGATDEEKKEFLADVSSFANATGGDLIFGVIEQKAGGRSTGIAAAVEGLSGANADSETLRLEQMLRDGIAPRIPGVQFRWVQGLPTGPVLIIRVPRSWSGPHMVTFKQHSRFYVRDSSGKHPLDVFELRQAFLASGSLSERAREFRAERLGRLLAGETPVELSGTSFVCVHLIPHAALAGAFELDLLLAANQGDNLQPLHSLGRSWTFNLDGFVAYAGSRSYLQVFRSGIVETVASTLLSTNRQDGTRSLPSLTFANELFAFIDRGRKLMRAIGAEPPASIFVSLLSARGTVLGINSRMSYDDDVRPFDRDNLLFRELLLTEWEGEARVIVKPLLDELWQAAGQPRCFFYNDQGDWKNPR